MANEGGLFINIVGDVSDKLLKDMDRLRTKLNRLSMSARSWSTTAKSAGNVKFGQEFDKIAKDIDSYSDSIDSSMEQIGGSVQSMHKKVGVSSEKVASQIAASNAKIHKSFDDLSLQKITKAGDKLTEFKKSISDRDIDTKGLRLALTDAFKADYGNTVEMQERARKEAKKLSDEMEKLYASMRASGAIDDESASFNDFAKNADLAKLKMLNVRGELKATKNGFEALSERSKHALNLEDWQIDAMTKKFSRTEDSVDGLFTKIGHLSDEMVSLDPKNMSPEKFEEMKGKVSSLRKELNKIATPMKEQYGEEFYESMDQSIISLNQTLKNYDAQKRELIKAEKDHAKAANASAASMQENDASASEYQKSLDKLINKITGLTEESKKLGSMSGAEFKDFSNRLNSTASELERVKGGMSTEAYEELRGEVLGLRDTFDHTKKSMADTAKAQTNWNKRVEATKAKTSELNDIMDELDGKQLDTTDPEQVRRFNERLSRAESLVKGLRTSARDIVPEASFKGFESRLSGLRGTVKDTRTQFQKFEDDLKQMENEDFSILPQSFLKNRQTDIRKLSNQLDKLRKTMSADEFKEFANRIDVTSGRLSKQKKAAGGAANMLDNFFSTIAKGLHFYNKFTGAMIRQIQFLLMVPGLITAVIAAYAGLGIAATKAGKALIDNSRKLTMSVEELQKLQYAAVTTGTSVRDLRDSLGEMNTTAIDALEGTKKAKQALMDSLNFDKDEVRNLAGNTSEMFSEIVKRLNEVDNSAKKMQLAEDIFGKTGGRSLLPLINRGTDSLEEMKEEAEEMGIILSEKMAAQANSAWTSILQLWSVIKHKFIAAAAEAAPEIRAISQALIDLIAKGNIFKDTLVPAIKFTIMAIGHLADIVNTARVAFWGLASAVAATTFSFGKSKEFALRMKKVMEQTVDVSSKLSEKLNNLKMNGDIWKKFANNMEDTQPYVESLDKSMSDLTDTTTTLFNKIKSLAGEGKTGRVDHLIPFSIANIKEKIKEMKDTRWEMIKSAKEEGTLFGKTDDARKIAMMGDSIVDLREKLQKLKTDLSLKAETKAFEQQLSNTMKGAEVAFEKDSVAFLKNQKQIMQAYLQQYEETFEKAKEGGTDKYVRKMKGKVLEQRKKIQEQEEKIDDKRYENAQEASQKNIDVINEELNKREALLKKQAMTGGKLEEQYAAKRVEANKEAARKIMESKRTQFEVAKMLYDKDEDEYISAEQAKIKAEQKYRNEKINSIQAQIEKNDALFEHEKKLAEFRKNMATANLREDEGTRYEIEGVQNRIKNETQSYLQAQETRLSALKKFKEESLAAYDERLRKAEGNERKYKEIERNRLEFVKDTNGQILELEDELARKRIREHGSVWKKAQLGATNFKDKIEKDLMDITKLTKSTAQLMTDQFSSAFSKFVLGSKSAQEAFQSLTSSMLKQITQMMTNYLTQKFMMMMMGSAFGGASSGGGMTGPPQAGTGTQSSTNMIGSLLSLFHSGGKVGVTNTPDKKVSPAAMADMMVPRLHNGLKPDEYPAVLQKGEEVKSKSQVSDEDGKSNQPNVVQNINVQTGPDGKIAQESMQQMKRKAGRSLNNALRSS